MESLSSFVLPDGTLNGRNLWKREPLYQGMNGKIVERFYPSPERSYIFKPLTNAESMDREAWIHRYVLNLFPPVYPQLLASSETGAGEAGWLVFEDLGRLRHEYSVELAMEVVKQMAWWHSFPESHWNGLTGQGNKPPVEQISVALMERRGEVDALLKEAGSAEGLDGLLHGLTEGEAYLGTRVLSHGDLHLGNYARGANGRLYIIDWEHMHLNTPFWDLYHLLDMSHPLFPKNLPASEREKLLGYYLKQSAYHGRKWDRDDFIRVYCCFSAVFSSWMLLLISGDLKRGDSVWPRDRLLAQKNETTDILTACLARLLFVNDEGDKLAW
ncbi:phosphotransferase family enzyme [Fontibacillus phaseoli]|uniref:Phosphotransferase family enzyme n=1 Tax=Fontibacillus phaseoli TaxID=1416533 RepID=A0A369B9M9_9BACL|nr:phosphotransferase [Fontibacillus phaseoli]RCX18220.1 phosphotransferase family enzyme [Fontibacillus phaseoli]